MYKVIKVSDLMSDHSVKKFEATINELALEGWKLQSLTPQIYEGGTDCNVAVFYLEEN
ncbi:DUF4177 domain-containing protein [Peribacillus sp. CSMR9]|uniref:DUF4177 domain-containing protein n=1 Tax=Peribacillus sp. CSMR9 TaxID=2981350 RepID=UPI00295363E3|nr:DUF4177 domain-containing protein [Peribacillus sp. CSMR9]MDV7767772.1 DUF4177 domain-containing protein [Peribacillus sp. CSMR9]